jgi:hypothetical protein
VADVEGEAEGVGAAEGGAQTVEVVEGGEEVTGFGFDGEGDSGGGGGVEDGGEGFGEALPGGVLGLRPAAPAPAPACPAVPCTGSLPFGVCSPAVAFGRMPLKQWTAWAPRSVAIWTALTSRSARRARWSGSGSRRDGPCLRLGSST